MAEGQGSRENEENEQSSPSQNGETSGIDLMVEAYAQEYASLDHTMDEIDVWMTKLEQQNDSLNAQLDELLESSRQARKELKELNETDEIENSDSMDCSSELNEQNETQ